MKILSQEKIPGLKQSSLQKRADLQKIKGILPSPLGRANAENKKKDDILEDKFKQQIRKRTKAGWLLLLEELEEADRKLLNNQCDFERKKSNGTITRGLLHPVDPMIAEPRLLPCKTRNKTRRLQCGLNILHGFKEEKNKERLIFQVSSASITFWPYSKIIHMNLDEDIILLRELQEAHERLSTNCLSQSLRILLYREYLPEQVTDHLKALAQQKQKHFLIRNTEDNSIHIFSFFRNNNKNSTVTR
ncbi:hypothetical protein HPG69_017410 [Diceros bicornis minor]|uniref:Uncharacterized protein n=1 Tax=Diceros bicornis minor TaxID=77932 RepID=A0A7J7EP63_DICBM|nr:hypothetical protein HPG69_017410 [Diceros bicornis minor]